MFSNTKNTQMLTFAVVLLFAFLAVAFGETNLRVENMPMMNGPMCHNPKLMGGSCTRYVKGYDITGITNTIHQNNFDKVSNACECMMECMKRANVCANWVWKYTGEYSSSWQAHRSCTLYSNFNLPTDVTLDYNGPMTSNAGKIEPPAVQEGGFVPGCMMNDGMTPDPDCVSGALWQVGTNKFLC